jgi:hypothetical protein
MTAKKVGADPHAAALVAKRKREPVACLICGTVTERHPGSRYCSVPCKQKAWRRGLAKKRTAAAPTEPEP